MASWGAKFFGYLDGLVPQFAVAESPLKSGQVFDIEMPDFSKDRVTLEKGEARLQVLAREKETGNIVAFLRPITDLEEGDFLAIRGGYLSPVLFTAHEPRARNTQNRP